MPCFRGRASVSKFSETAFQRQGSLTRARPAPGDSALALLRVCKFAYQRGQPSPVEWPWRWHGGLLADELGWERPGLPERAGWRYAAELRPRLPVVELAFVPDWTLRS